MGTINHWSYLGLISLENLEYESKQFHSYYTIYGISNNTSKKFSVLHGTYLLEKNGKSHSLANVSYPHVDIL